MPLIVTRQVEGGHIVDWSQPDWGRPWFGWYYVGDRYLDDAQLYGLVAFYYEAHLRAWLCARPRAGMPLLWTFYRALRPAYWRVMLGLWRAGVFTVPECVAVSWRGFRQTASVNPWTWAARRRERR